MPEFLSFWEEIPALQPPKIDGCLDFGNFLELSKKFLSSANISGASRDKTKKSFSFSALAE